MVIIKIAQEIELSEQFKNWIQRKVQFSMQDSEKEIFQYLLETILEQMDYWLEVLDEKATWTSTDTANLMECKQSDIDYIEF